MNGATTSPASRFATRFLLPFCFDARQGSAVRIAITASGWREHPPHQNYLADYHDAFCRRCFGERGHWNVYQWNVDASKRRPGHEFSIRIKDQTIPAAFWNQDGRDIELFLGEHGVGVFSITLCPKAARQKGSGAFTLDEIKTFNYALSQDRDGRRKPALISKAEGEVYSPVSLKELAEEFLLPIRGGDFGWRIQNELAQLIPYTVVRFNSAVTLSGRVAPTASAIDYLAEASLLAQVGEANHPLPADDYGAQTGIFHSDELFAVSCMGAAAFVTDVGTQMDEQKLQSRLDTYFVCFLSAITQRLRLLQLLEAAGDVASLPAGTVRDASLEALRTSMLTVAARGDLVEVSCRAAINRYFGLCQRAQQVPQVLSLVQATIADMDASFQAQRQAGSLDHLRQSQQALHELAVQQQNLALEQSTHTRHMALMQTKVEWIEVFLISFYAAELVGLIGEQFRLDHGYVSVAVLVAMFGGGVVSALLLKPWDVGPQKSSRWRPPMTFVSAVTAVLVLLSIFIAGGRTFAPRENDAESTRDELKGLRQDIKALTSALERSSKRGVSSVAGRREEKK